MLTVTIHYRTVDGGPRKELVATVNTAQEARAYQVGLEREGFEFLGATLQEETDHAKPIE